MNNFRKALGKEDSKKYRKKVEISGIKKSSHWKHIDQIIECNQKPKQTQQTLKSAYQQIIQQAFEKGELNNFLDHLDKLKLKYCQYNKLEIKNIERLSQDYILEDISQILQKMTQQSKSIIQKNYLNKYVEELKKYMIQKQKQIKKQSLKEYDQMVKGLKINNNKNIKTNFNQFEKKLSSINNENCEHLLNKSHKILLEDQPVLLKGSLSGGNLRIMVTKEEFQYELKEKPERSKKKSEGNIKNRNKESNSSKNLTKKKSDTDIKLQKLLKDKSKKVIKTKIEYNCSAIFEASKQNIHSRNKTNIYDQEKNNKEGITKISNSKKNEGFVFYRPKHKK